MAESDRVVVRRTSLLAEVRRADPEWDREGKRPVAYRMSNGREFREVEGSAYTEGESPASSDPDVEPRTYYVSTLGNDTNTGLAINSPLATVQAALDVLRPGDRLIVRGGTYMLADFIDWSTSEVECSAYGTEVAIFDGTNIPTPDTYNSRVMRVHDCHDVTFTGLRFTKGPDGGVLVDGVCDGIVFENCHFYRNGRASVAEGQGIVIHDDIDGNGDRVTNCTLINCDSYFNLDVLGGGGNADGFQVSAGAGHRLVGCRSYRNSDDGFDTFNIARVGGLAIEGVRYENCWAWENGYDEAGDEAGGDGNGFKLGGQREGLGNTSGGNTVIDCMSWGNREIGFTDNEATNPNEIYNSIAFDNGRMNIEAGTEANPGVAHTIRNCIAYQAPEANVSIQITTNVDHNSWDSGLLVTSLDWMSTDDTAATGGRLAGGTLPTSEFLVLRGNPGFASDMIEAGTDVGLPFSGAAPNLGPSFTPGVFVPPEPQAETLAIVAAYATDLDTYGIYLIDVLVVALKDAGIWSKLDALWFPAAPAAADAWVNWIDPGTYDLTPVNSPNFLAGVGYAGNGVDSDLDTGAPLDGLTHFQQDDACLFVWCATESPATTMREAGDTSASVVQMMVQGSAARAACYLNSVDYANGVDADAPSTVGLFCASRLSDSEATLYVNDTAISTNSTQASNAPPAENLRLGQASGTYSTRRLSAAGIGAGLTAEQIQGTLYPAIREYVASVA